MITPDQRSSGVDEYTNDRMDSPHLTPRLIVEKPILPNLTVWVRADGQAATFQRWYDVSADVINGVGVRSIDFVPDGVVRLIDKHGSEIARAAAKLTDDFEGLPLVLARIEKMWECAKSATEFWQTACDILVRSRVPDFDEVMPGLPILKRQAWMEIACQWIAFLARTRQTDGHAGWEAYTDGDRLLLQYIDFWNNAPGRGPDLSVPKYPVDLVLVGAGLEAVRQAKSNEEKKETLEDLSEVLLEAVPGFQVLPGRNTATGEIDRLVRNISTHPILSRLGTLILVECKNWSTAVDTDSIGAFLTDLQEAGLTCGILLTRRAVSREGKRRILVAYQQQRIFILTVTERDIDAVRDGGNLPVMLIEKMEALMLGRVSDI